MGYGLDNDGLHSPNEHYSIEMFQRGIETAIVYLEELAQLPALTHLRWERTRLMSIRISERSLKSASCATSRSTRTADPTSPTSPSTQIQFDLLNLLVDELKEIGAQDVTLTAYGAVLATIPATVQADVPTIALLAHVDTAPQFSGTNVKPIVHRNYDGERHRPARRSRARCSRPRSLPYLAQKVGDDIVTASGTTLLGADDKAGIAIIMAAARHLLQHPEISARPDPHRLHARRGDRPRRACQTCRPT